MKITKKIGVLFLMFVTAALSATAQTAKTPASCKIFLEAKAVSEVTVEEALSWCDMTPPTVQCDDGKVYFIETCQVSFFTLKPLQNKDFGIGEGGIPIMARNAVSKGMPGDALVLKEVNCIDSDGNKIVMPVISFKLK